VETQHQESGELYSSPPRRPVTQRNLDKSPTFVTDSTLAKLGSESPTLETQHQEFHGASAVETQHQESGELDSSPPRRPITQRNLDELPTSEAKLPSVRLTLCGSDYDSLPTLGKRVAKKQIFYFIRVESNSNLKGIIQRNCDDNGGRQRKKLTWWDDDANKCKPFTLKTDASFDWDDDSTWSHAYQSDWKCNDRIQDFLQRKRVRWIDEGEDSPCEAPELDLFACDEPMDSDDDGAVYRSFHIPMDKEKRKMIGDLVGYYKEKLEDSFSHVVEASKQWNLEDSFSMDSIDNAITSTTEDERMANLLKVDLFDVSSSFRQDEDDESIGDCSQSTLQACNTSCFAA